ncbi:IS66 family insertion sequence hypothetical protein [Saccharobesus litoralis]|uniref:Transposase n=1 Tax=Saccharobesus litoralis TaxID=2172099 RepID=A0A2S0VS63_9ALTE|nr:hypothetical protein [Saccharobesus litoralis]AWB66266.1 IS66 family insertion sequence hypothetical protein [Saccharobesus litoralis]AWB67012.1 IS66 family insertion sequence hypothetical protein [Saccharobesus litoralis]
MGKQRTIEDWQLIFSQFHASGLTVTQFCKQHKLTISNFYKWRKRIEPLPATNSENDIEFSASTDHWQAISVNHHSTDTKQWNIELTLPGGVVLNMRATS